MGSLLKFIVSIIIPFVAAAVGNLATIPNIPTWYATLDKPWFNPPNWVFGPIWTLLYLLMGLSLFLIWRASYKKSKRKALSFFGIQLALNALWSLVFFGLHAPLAALVVIVLLWVCIAITILQFKKISRTAALLLIPYLAWVSFAAILNAAIATLN